MLSSVSTTVIVLREVTPVVTAAVTPFDVLTAVFFVTTVVTTGYLLGSIPVANLVARANAGVDLRDVGDRNPGYWNAKGQLGRRVAAAVFAGDVAKGAIAALFGLLMATDGRWWMCYLGGLAAMVGHAWPLFDGFRGGRSVLTFVGAVIVCATVPSIVGIALLGAVWIASRNFAWAARAGIVSLPIIQQVLQGPFRTAATGLLMAFIGLRFWQAALESRTTAHANSDAT